MPPQVRQYQDADREAVLGMVRSLYDFQARECGLVRTLREGGEDEWLRAILPALGSFALLLVAVEAEVPCGVLLLRLKAYPKPLGGETVGFISEVFVHPERRGRGVASLLHDEALRWLLERGIARVELNVVPGNDKAMAFWQALGYEPELTQLGRNVSV